MKFLYTYNVLSLPVIFFLTTGIIYFFSGCSRDKTVPGIKGMVHIPAGTFIIGSDDEDTNLLAKDFGAREKKFFENEKPARKINIKGFHIDKYEVTNNDYKLFIFKTGHEPPPNWEDPEYLQAREMHPVSAVSWFDASEYCKWTGKRLPTEEEWEKSARGTNGNKYPWGNNFDVKKANLNKGDTVPVGNVPEDKSFYGVYDMGGNVTEWTDSWYKPYPGSTFQSKYFGEVYKVVKGAAGSLEGHYNMGSINARGSFREYYPPTGKGVDVGFRCAMDE